MPIDFWRTRLSILIVFFGQITVSADLCDGPFGVKPDQPAESVTRNQDTDFDYQLAVKLSNLFYQAQMSGVLPDWHQVPWRGDAGLKDGCDINLDLR